MAEKVCAQCSNYRGGGDWGLCCSKKYDLTYEDTPADDCADFEQLDECRNASCYIGAFMCSNCGSRRWITDTNNNVEPRPTISFCPDCGREIDAKPVIG